MKIVKTEIAELHFNAKESILHIKIIKGAEMNIKNTEEHYKTIEEITGGKKYLALIDSSEYFTIDSETLKFTASPKITEKRIATAHYRPSMGNKLTIDFFRKFHSPSLPVNSFATKKEALEWLKSR
jgi:hypothetical protein